MNMKRSMILKSGTVGAVALALAACGSQSPAPSPEPTETASSASSPAIVSEEPVSIIRPDAEVQGLVTPLEQLAARISFDEGGFKLSASAQAELTAVLESRQYEAGGMIILRGHTDSAGNDRANLRASQRRAEAVRDWLVERGAAEGRIEVIAMGEQNPLKPNAKPDGSPDEAARAFNRRVDLTIAIPAELRASVEAAKPTLVEKVTAN